MLTIKTKHSRKDRVSTIFSTPTEVCIRNCDGGFKLIQVYLATLGRVRIRGSGFTVGIFVPSLIAGIDGFLQELPLGMLEVIHGFARVELNMQIIAPVYAQRSRVQR